MRSPHAELLGAQTPRIGLNPAGASNDAPDAIDLGIGYGLTADPWQAFVLHGWLAVQESGKWAAPRCGLAVPRQNGKNGALELRELFGMVQLGERILHTAHEVKTARKAFMRLLHFFDNRKQYPDLADMVVEIRKTNGQEAIFLDNGGSVEFVARSKKSGRGFSVDLLVLDEAQDLAEDELAALLPTISASPNPQRIMLGSPPSGSAGEPFLRMRTEGLTGTAGRLSWNEWSIEAPADGTELDLDDVALWALTNPAYGIRLDHDTLQDERDDMDDETFGRERLGMWNAAGGTTALNLQQWLALAIADGDAAAPRPVVDGPLVFAIDVTPERSATSIGAAGYLQDGSAFVDLLEHAGGVTWAVPCVVALAAKWGPVTVVVDGASPAASLVPELREAGIEVTVTGPSDMAAGCGAFYDRVVDGTVRHKAQAALNAAIGAAKKRRLGDAFAWQRKDATDISPLVAVTLALHGLITAPAREDRKRKRTGKAW